MSADPVVIVSYARTPMGGFQGALAGASATQLGETAVKAAVERARIDQGAGGPDSDGLRAARRLPAGAGQAGRPSAPGLPTSVAATTASTRCRRLGPAGGDPRP